MGLFSRKKEPITPAQEPMTAQQNMPTENTPISPAVMVNTTPVNPPKAPEPIKKTEPQKIDRSVEPGSQTKFNQTSLFDGINEPEGWEMHKPVRVLTRVYTNCRQKTFDDYSTFCMTPLCLDGVGYSREYGFRTDRHALLWQGWLTGCTISDLVEQLKDGRSVDGNPLIDKFSIVEFVPPHGISRAVIMDESLNINGPYDFCPLMMKEYGRKGGFTPSLANEKWKERRKEFAPWTDAYIGNMNGSADKRAFRVSLFTFPQTLQALYISNEGTAIPMRIASDLRQLNGLLLPDTVLDTPCPSAHIRREKIGDGVYILSTGGLLSEPVRIKSTIMVMDINRLFFKTIKDENGVPIAETYGCSMINANNGKNEIWQSNYKERMLGSAVVIGFDDRTGLPRGLTEEEVEKYRRYGYAEEWHPVSEKLTDLDNPYLEKICGNVKAYDLNDDYESRVWDGLINQLDIPQKAMFAFDADVCLRYQNGTFLIYQGERIKTFKDYMEYINHLETKFGLDRGTRRKQDPDKEWYDWKTETNEESDARIERSHQNEIER